jgi:hypothetical protein
MVQRCVSLCVPIKRYETVNSNIAVYVTNVEDLQRTRSLLFFTVPNGALMDGVW